MNEEERKNRRIKSAIYRAATSTDEAFYRVLSRIARLADETVMLDVWYRVKPEDAPLIDKWLSYRILDSSPLRSIPPPHPESLRYPVKLTRMVTR